MDLIEFASTHLASVLALAATGIFAGLLAGLLGVGGGIVIVPVLFFLFQRFGVSSAPFLPLFLSCTGFSCNRYQYFRGRTIVTEANDFDEIGLDFR